MTDSFTDPLMQEVSKQLEAARDDVLAPIRPIFPIDFSRFTQAELDAIARAVVPVHNHAPPVLISASTLTQEELDELVRAGPAGVIRMEHGSGSVIVERRWLHENPDEDGVRP